MDSFLASPTRFLAGLARWLPCSGLVVVGLLSPSCAVEADRAPRSVERARAAVGYQAIADGVARLNASLLAEPGSVWDQDWDGLDDLAELDLAEAFSPYLLFDSSEAARQDFEPVTLFQVRPLRDEGTHLTVRVRYIFLFEHDGGYGPSSVCGDSHPGDNDNLFMDLRSSDGGITFSLLRINLDRFEYPRDTLASFVERSHPRLYLSGSKHHQYFNREYDEQDSPYSAWGCADDVDGDGARFFPNLRSVADLQGGNNLGEPEAHSSWYFVDRIFPFYPSQSAWDGTTFFGVETIRNKVMTFPKPDGFGR